MKEEQFNQLPSQGTIYSTGRLGNHLILGAGNSGKVFAQMSNSLVQQIPLQNLPYECDVISIDAYIDAFPVLAVAFVQKCNPASHGAMLDGRGKGHVTSHLNIYSTWISVDQDSPTSTSSTSSEGSKFSKPTFHPKEEFHASQFELISQNCTSFLLGFLPYHLHHIPVVKQNGNFGNILLLSGSDCKIHSYEADDDNLTFVEVSVKIYFPELSQTFPSVVTRLLIQPVNEVTRRITLCGLESGNLLIWIVSSKIHKRKRQDSEVTVGSGSITPSRSLQGTLDMELLTLSETEQLLMGSRPLSLDENNAADDKRQSVSVREDDNDASEGAWGQLGDSCGCMTEAELDSVDESFENIEHHFEGLITSIKAFSDGFNHHVIVASALSPTYVYNKVIEERFNAGTPLKFSGRFDAVECCCVEDIDHDGENEIIIGTFGCTLLVYKYMDEILPEWVIVAIKKFPRAILAIEFVNPYLHVVTGLGLHIVKYETSTYFTNKPGPTPTESDPEENEDDADVFAPSPDTK